MDVEDKTKIVFPVAQRGKDAASDVSEEKDHTVFAGKNLNAKSTSSNFSSSFGDPAIDSELVQKSQVESDLTTFVVSETESSNQQQSFPSSIVERSENTDSFVVKNRFELKDLLGAGGMGAVYKAVDRRKLEASDKKPFVAIKLLNDDFRKHPDALISLQREARKSQALAHPNIVNVYDFDRDGDRVFMTMEYLVGSPLDVLLRERSGLGLPMSLALSTLRDISNALIYAHSHNIIHSDFKPGNIFVTEENGTKVFDFGIAKAVKPTGAHAASENDHTVFDAASLGALTPAYASLEMLQGDDPAPADDVYALACVAYELFAGRHPYNKTPADKARKQGLKPVRIKSLNRRQWRALEKALQFSRKDRTASVSDFVEGFYGRSRAGLWLMVSGVAGVSLVAAIYAANYTSQVIDENAIKQEVQQQLEQQILQDRILEKKQSLQRLINLGVVTPAWEADVQAELAIYRNLVPEDKQTPLDIRQSVATALLAAAEESFAENKLVETESLIERASLWSASDDDISRLQSDVAQAYEARKQKLQEEKEAALARQREQKVRQQKDAERRQALTRQRDIAQVMSVIETGLRCGSSIDISGSLTSAVNHLSKLDRNLAERVEPNIATDLSQCALKLSQTNPQVAQEKLVDAQTLFPGSKILQSTRIDFCNHLAPGSGARGSRFGCQDLMPSGDRSPEMVVINAEGNRVAISRHEISYADMSTFCKAGDCASSLRSEAYSNNKQPVTNVDASQILRYLSWMSLQTGYEYRLPTLAEWKAAATQEREDPDRNCHLRFGAIQKGSELVPVQSGKVNSNGLKHMVGNVQELVRSDGGFLAMGGARTDAMSRCLVSTKKKHAGTADEVTGFRLVRSL